MIIDFHTHVFPPRICEAAISSLEASSCTKAVLDGSAEALSASAKQSGVDYCVILPVATNIKQVSNVNNYVASLMDKYDNFICFGGIHPEFPELKKELRRIREMGMKGVKIHPDFVQTFADSQAMVRTMNMAAEEGLMVILHSGVDLSFPEVVRCTPERIYRILPQIKDVTLILAHAGGYLYFSEFEKYLFDSGVYIDISAVLGIGCDEQLKRIFESYDSERILFGTDSPWVSQKEYADQLRSLELDKELFDKITYKNAKRLLQI